MTTVLFNFPPVLPVTGNNMNYCVAVLAVIAIISAATWFIDGRKNYHGPKLDAEILKAAEIAGIQVESRSSGPPDMGEKEKEKVNREY